MLISCIVCGGGVSKKEVESEMKSMCTREVVESELEIGKVKSYVGSSLIPYSKSLLLES